MPYHVVTATNEAELEKEVERFEKMDWKPQGGVAFCLYFTYEADKSHQNAIWAQAMTKEAPKVTMRYPTESPAYRELYAQ